MELSALSGVPAAGLPELVPAASPAGTAPGAEPFSKLIGDVLRQAGEQGERMDNDIRSLAAGHADNLHQIVLNVAEADLTLRLLMEVRDRLITSYQEIMRMQI